MDDRNTERKREIIRRHGSENEKAMQKEIESLRSQVNAAITEVGKIGRQLGMAQARGDEWKRRAEEMWMWMHKTWVENLEFSKVSDDYRNHNPEAAKWFEEKDA
ncbi:unnamed protein product [marine sediment metagenome]|uniref:Uncharacterized protein n=1 Tax=marine sediment metagenome TaxID=412755 RepID=X0TCV8_9ZZZZ